MGWLACTRARGETPQPPAREGRRRRRLAGHGHLVSGMCTLLRGRTLGCGALAAQPFQEDSGMLPQLCCSRVNTPGCSLVTRSHPLQRHGGLISLISLRAAKTAAPRSCAASGPSAASAQRVRGHRLASTSASSACVAARHVCMGSVPSPRRRAPVSPLGHPSVDRRRRAASAAIRASGSVTRATTHESSGARPARTRHQCARA